MNTIQFPDAPDRIKYAIEADILQDGDWGDGTEAVCMMSAMVPDSENVDDCVTAGWPAWLVETNVNLFDLVGPEEPRDRKAFAVAVAQAVSRPVDHEKARKFYEARMLEETSRYSYLTDDQDSLVRRVINGDRSENTYDVLRDALRMSSAYCLTEGQRNALHAAKSVFSNRPATLVNRLRVAESPNRHMMTQCARGFLVQALYEGRTE